MKNFITCCALLLFTADFYPNNPVFKGKVLEVTVKAKLDSEAPVQIKWVLMENNEILPVNPLKCPDEKFRFSLKANTHYTIFILAPGYHPRKISINTELPPGINSSLTYEVDALVFMIPDTESLNPEMEDYPVAIINYCKNARLFVPSRNYTLAVKKELFVEVKNKTAEKSITWRGAR